MVLLSLDLASLIPQYKSRAEEQWANEGYLIIDHDLHETVVWTRYEAIRLSLPGGFYTVDFVHVTDAGHMVLVEVKGSTKQGSYRDARSKWRAAVELFPFFIFGFAVLKRDSWEVEWANVPEEAA